MVYYSLPLGHCTDFTNPHVTLRTWFNQQGNREMYMNCAVVTISGGRRSVRDFVSPRAAGTPLFQANIGNGCSTAPGTDVIFPDPGDDVTYGNGAKTAPPVGSCGPSSGKTGPGTSTGSGAGNGGNNGDTAPGNDRGCAYWRAQGYICSAGIGLRERLPFNWWLLMSLLFGFFA